MKTPLIKGVKEITHLSSWPMVCHRQKFVINMFRLISICLYEIALQKFHNSTQ